MIETEQATQEERQIKNQINLLSSSMDHLLKHIEELSTRLKPALRDEPSCRSTQNKEERELVEIATDIRLIHYRICDADNRITDIMERLEI